MLDVENVNPVENLARGFRVPGSNKCLRDGLQNLNLLQVVRAFIDLCDVGRTGIGFSRLIRTTVAQLRRSQPP